MIGGLSQIRCLSQENYENLVSECTKYCSKLLKKQDQVQYLLMACQMFNNPFLSDPQRVQ
jgi:hypothetical protein